MRDSFQLLLKIKNVEKLSGSGWLPGALRRANDLAGADAASARLHGLSRAGDNRFHRLEIRQPTRPGLDIGVRNPVAADRTFFTISANACHD
jgi:hypothetical protein